MKRNVSLAHLAILASVLAFTVLATSIRISVPDHPGYFHLGDAVIFSAALLFGPKTGFMAGAAGSALADLILGLPMWAPYSFVIKGSAGYVVGVLSLPGEPGRDAVAIAGGALVIVSGYATLTALIVGLWAVPVEVLGDLGQVLAGGLLALLVTSALRRFHPQVLSLRPGRKKR